MFNARHRGRAGPDILPRESGRVKNVYGTRVRAVLFAPCFCSSRSGERTWLRAALPFPSSRWQVLRPPLLSWLSSASGAHVDTAAGAIQFNLGLHSRLSRWRNSFRCFGRCVPYRTVFSAVLSHHIRMKIRDLTAKQLVSVRCPTCGVAPGKRCLLHSGAPRSTSHVDRKLSAAEAIETKKPSRRAGRN
jgi:hypothetical protein